MTETIVPLSTLTSTGSPGGTSCAPPAGVTVSFAGCAVGAGAEVGPPPDVPLADTVGSLLHAPSVSTATKPSATAAPRRRVEVLTVNPFPFAPLVLPLIETSRGPATLSKSGVTKVTTACPRCFTEGARVTPSRIR
ncbi:hypothetical protein Amsp01_069820 [Amycolatopsis sp. NBRC 101858]|nr:hypothetical protein Amsp01_069820 [Amycolatopsis sp. NBRC 101858]